MHSKNNNKTNLFIQGLRPFSSSIPKTLKKYIKKGGYNYSNIVDNWSNMVNKKISNSCYPAAIKMGKKMKNGTLILNVIHGKEIEIEYEKKGIIDKINSFFGYDCISHITLKIVHTRLSNVGKITPKLKNLSKIEKRLKNIDNENLKISLKNLIKAYNENK
tara:strand:+ start:207 stop:689 length:483 start_codon:yes stop_codon:yes gene_type:complete